MEKSDATAKKHRHRHKSGHKHGEGFSIDYYAYLSKIRDWNPAFKVGFALVTLFLCVGFNNPWVSLLIIAGMAWLTIVKGGLSVHKYISLMTIPVFFMIFGSIAIAVGFSTRPAGQYWLNLNWFYIYTSAESLRKTAFLILKAFGAVSAMYMMTLSTPSGEIISVLRKAHVPKLIIELMNMIYRYIFILIDVQARMKNSAASRLGYCDYKTSLFTFGGIASNLFIVSLKKAGAYYDALESRGYNGELLFLEQEKPVEIKQMIAAAGFIAVITAVWFMTK